MQGGQTDIYCQMRRLDAEGVRPSACGADLLILYFMEGACRVGLDGGEETCACGDAALIQKNEIYRVAPSEDQAWVLFLELTAEHFQHFEQRDFRCAGQLAALTGEGAVLHLSEEEDSRLRPLMEDYILKYAGADAYARYYRMNALELALVELCRALEGRESLREPGAYSETEKSRLIKSVIAYINEHYREDIHLDSIARQFWVSPSYLSRQFKSKVGVNITRFITERRVQVAQKLLIASDLNITEIALQLGFKNANYFNTVFRKTQGVSPREYRKRKQISGALLERRGERGE